MPTLHDALESYQPTLNDRLEAARIFAVMDAERLLGIEFDPDPEDREWWSATSDAEAWYRDFTERCERAKQELWDRYARYDDGDAAERRGCRGLPSGEDGR